MPRFTGSVLRYFRDTDGRLMWMDLDSGIRIVNVFAGTDIAAQGKRPWRLNARLLNDREILVDVARLIQRKVHATPEQDGDRWDEVKADVAECFRSWGKGRAREDREEIRIISGVILLLSRPESTGPGIASALVTLRKELRVALQRRWDGLKAVARAERWEMEAWCSRTILRRHLARKHTPLMSLINPETGSLVETPDGVLEVAKRFYENLYAEPTPPSADFPFVKNDQVFELCDSPFVEEELHAALVTMKRNRSPGTDGLTVEFYVKLWEVLGKPFTALYGQKTQGRLG
ncbi:hypothetical protein MRX96_004656 [Rhipicephalus microplus]